MDKGVIRSTVVNGIDRSQSVHVIDRIVGDDVRIGSISIGSGQIDRIGPGGRGLRCTKWIMEPIADDLQPRVDPGCVNSVVCRHHSTRGPREFIALYQGIVGVIQIDPIQIVVLDDVPDQTVIGDRCSRCSVYREGYITTNDHVAIKKVVIRARVTRSGGGWADGQDNAGIVG